MAARLPAERELAVALGVSRTTVAAAYEALRAEGYAKSRRGAGSWTAIPEGRPVPAGGLEPLPPEAAESMIDLGIAALPAPEPWLTRAMEGAIAELPAYAATHGDFPAGLPALREAIAERCTARGVPTMPEQIMVTTGAMGAIAEHVGSIAELEQALQRARSADRTYVICIDTDATRTTSEGGCWWEVAVPEVSERANVREARQRYERSKEAQRI